MSTPMNTDTQQHIKLVSEFYQAFQRKDFQAMIDCYHPDVQFQDPAFTLQGKAAGAMWHMLVSRGTDLTLEFSVSEAEGKVTAHWEPKYSFSKTGRQVHNIIDAQFEFKDGLIYRHQDHFDFWRWSKQALGTPAYLLGWTSFFQSKVSSMANKTLSQFIKKHPEYQ